MTAADAIEIAKSFDSQTTTEQAAAIAIDILKGLKPVKDERDELMAELSTRANTLEESARLTSLTDQYVDLACEATRVMKLFVFSGTEDYEIRDWISDDFDGLMADLADIARGDF